MSPRIRTAHAHARQFVCDNSATDTQMAVVGEPCAATVYAYPHGATLADSLLDGTAIAIVSYPFFLQV